MSIKILVNGAAGKMGQLAITAISQCTELELVGSLGRNHDLLSEIKQSKAAVVIDFTNADSALKNTEIIIESGAHPVIGTSGLVKDQVALLQKKSAERQVGGIIAPNFSLGAVLMMKYAEAAAPYFSQVEIIEMHHPGKLDSPSGTAIRTAEMIAAARKESPSASQTTRETIKGARGANYENIPIHAVRLPGFIASQEVMFGGLGEVLKIRHDATDRQCFISGIILACKKVVTLTTLVYGLEHVL